MTPAQRLQQLRQLADGSLSRTTAIRQRDPLTGDYVTGATLRNVIEELRIELDALGEALTEWEDAEDTEARRDARADAEGAASNVMAELANLGVIAPTLGDAKRTAAELATADVTRTVRRKHTDLPDDVEELLPVLVRDVLDATGYVHTRA